MHKAKRKHELTEGRPRSTQAERRARSEAAIISAVRRLIGEHGTVGTTVAEIAKAARCSQGLPMHLFGNKENLVIRAVQAMITSGRGWGLLEPERGFVAFLKSATGWFPAAARHQADVRALLVLINEALLGHAAKKFSARAAAVQAIDKEYRQHIRRLLKSGIARGEVRSDIDLDIEPALILSSVRGIFSQWLISPESIDLERAGKYWLAELERTLSPAQAHKATSASLAGRLPSATRVRYNDQTPRSRSSHRRIR